MILSKYPRMVAMLARRNPDLIGKQMGPRKPEALAGRVQFHVVPRRNEQDEAAKLPF